MTVGELIDILQKCDKSYIVKHDDSTYISSVVQIEDMTGTKSGHRVSLR